jgi:DNA end-binding protein Ku
MAERPIWRGHLRLALVSCPVALYTARHDSAQLRFHFINPATGHRVRMVTTDAETGEELQRRDLARGYEFRKDTYVLLDEADFERARIDSSSTLTIDKFVPADSIDPVYYDASYYVAPDGDAGRDVYAVLHQAIAKSRRIALSRVVIARRERAVAIMPMGDGLVCHTLHDRQEVHDPADLFAPLGREKPDADMVKLAGQLIERQSGRFVPGDMEDRYEARLREVIEAKLAGQEIVEPEQEPDRGNVVDLMAALKRSLGQDEDAPAARRSPAAGKTGAAAKPARKAPATAPGPARATGTGKTRARRA